MPLLKRIFAVGAVVLLVALAGVLLSTCSSTPDPENTAAIEPSVPPGAESPYLLSVPDHYHFLQKDAAWADAKMGASPGTLRDYGCLLTSVSMAAANLGVEVDPGALNAQLSAVNGYTPRGWLKWGALKQATGGQLAATIYGAPDGDQIDNCLIDGHYPVVKFMLDDRVQHWALVVGKTDDDWAVRDPLDTTRTVRPLGDLTSRFESVRCIRPAEGS